MPLKHLEYWILAQIVLEVLMMALILVFLTKMKRLRRMLAACSTASGQGSRASISPAAGSRSTESETASMDNVLAQLAQRSANLQQHLQQLESKVAEVDAVPSQEPEEPSLRYRVEQLYRRGLPMEEIARRLDMNMAEVKVALELSRVAAR
ncbi:MAG: hypothetical protein FJ128_03740 [Deltaproteobacteria bacterium]|nr:hypothetical protein [Deltaproteobacteria bacterium]